MTSSLSTPKRFAPLKEGGSLTGLPRLEGIVFDVDGTLCEPQTYMFAEMRAALGITKATDILEHIYALPTPEAQVTAMKSVRDIERAAMVSQVAQPGLVELMAYLNSRGVRKAICTRNFDAPVTHLLAKFLADSVFDPIITREFRPPKPHPAGILHIAKSWGLVTETGNGIRDEGGLGAVRQQQAGQPDASGLIMVGDSIDDMTAGRRAGATTVLLANDVNRDLAVHDHTDLVIDRLDDLIAVLDEGLVKRPRREGESSG